MDYSDKANKYKILYQIGGLIEGRIVNLYFIRHGESMHNLNQKNKNIFDSPLTNNGITQSTNLYKNILDIKPDLIYTSPLRRTLQTLFYSLLNQINTKIPIIIDDDVREFNRGRPCDFRHNKDQIIKFTKLFNYNNIDYTNISNNPNSNKSESFENVNKRVQIWLEKLKIYIKDKPHITNIVVYSHAMFIRAALDYLSKKIKKNGTCDLDKDISNGIVCAHVYSVDVI
jgi:probable phosphoglycerate mutase